jgi:Adenylate and Guanylate cyclase catalytic domain
MLRHSLRSLSYQMTLFTTLTQSVWPNVTVDNFATQASQFVTTIAEYPVVLFTPNIIHHQRNAWESYAVNIYENSTKPPIQPRYRTIWGSFPGSELSTSLPSDAEGPFHPIHQIYEGFIGSSTVEPIILYDMMTAIGYNEFYVNTIKKYNRGFISRTLPLDVYREAYSNVDRKEPLSLVTEPIFNSTSLTTMAQDPLITLNQKSTLVQVGAVTSIFQWKALFHSVLKEGNTQIYCHVTNICDDDFAFTVNGQMVAFVGSGDPNILKTYANVKVTVSLDDPFFAPPPRNVTNSGYCPYTLEIYPGVPGQSMANNDDDTTPILLYAGIVGTVFLFSTFCLLLYFEIARRSNQIRYTKLKAMNAPTMLLAYDVNHTLKSEDNHTGTIPDDLLVPNQQELINPTVVTPKLSNTVLRNDETFNNDKQLSKNHFSYKKLEGFHDLSKSFVPDLYPNTTILVADVAGFTPWASEREPSQVFVMLETIFQSFDVIAKRHHIIKIDSVGDSYVAAAGCDVCTPNNREIHAVSMARFGCHIMKRTSDLMQKLEILLGPGKCRILYSVLTGLF